MIAATPNQQQSTLTRAPSRYRRKSRSTTISNGSASQPAHQANPPTDVLPPPMPSVPRSALDAMANPVTTFPGLSQFPPPSLSAAQIEPISLGYRKVYNKDSPLTIETNINPGIMNNNNNISDEFNDNSVSPSGIQSNLVDNSSSLSPRSRTKKTPVSTVFNPLNPFLQELKKSVSNTSNTTAASNTSLTDAPNEFDESAPVHTPTPSPPYVPDPISNKATDPAAETATADADQSNPTTEASLASQPCQQELSQQNKSSTTSPVPETASVQSPESQPVVDLYVKGPNDVTIKFMYIDNAGNTTPFAEHLLPNQSFADVIKTIVARHQNVLPSTDPNDFMLWEVCPSLGLRRALRSTEYLGLVHQTWPAVTSNYLQLDSYEERLNIASVAFLAPRRDIIQSAGPGGPTFYARCYYQVGKSWKKVHIMLNNGTLTISRKPPNERLSSKDVRTVSSISQFDIYEVAGSHGSHPGRYTMAIRSQLQADVFVDKKDCVHVFATDNSNDYTLFRNIVFTLRSQACDKEGREYRDFSKYSTKDQQQLHGHMNRDGGRMEYRRGSDDREYRYDAKQPKYGLARSGTTAGY